MTGGGEKQNLPRGAFGGSHELEQLLRRRHLEPGSVDDGGRSSPADPACEAAVKRVKDKLNQRLKRARSAHDPSS